MLQNFLKIAWRNLYRNKSFSILNILGLSIGLAITAIILIWISHEFNMDQFHKDVDRIYQVNNQHPVNGEIWTWNSTPKIMGPTIKKDYAEVENVVRVNWEMGFLFAKDDIRINGKGNIVDSDFLEVFSFPLLEGNPKNVLSNVNSVVITKSFAKKIFGTESAIGQTVKIDNRDLFTVSGILKNLPATTSFEFDFLIPWSYMKQRDWDDTHWGNNSIATYVKLKKEVDYNSFSEKIKTLRKNYDKEGPDQVTYLYPFSRTWLHDEFENGVESGGRIIYIRMFGIIAIIILIIACINFMNLSTARSEKRTKEVGVRKVLGASRPMLINQFLGESIFISLLSGIIALLLIQLVLPYFSKLVEIQLSLDFQNIWFWLVAIGVIIFTGILGGSYPAFFLSSFKPSLVLKGIFTKANYTITPRKVLVILQFSAAIILISSSIIVSQQLKKAQNRQNGYSKDSLIYTFMKGNIEKNYNLIKQEILASGIATSLTKTSSPITQDWSNTWSFKWKGKDIEDRTLVNRFIADQDILKTFGFKLISGRDFNLKEFPTDSTAAIINEGTVELMGFKDPIGQIIKDDDIDWHVIGVIEDFIIQSPFEKIPPMVIEGAKGWFNIIHIKLDRTKNISDSLSKIESIYKKYNPEYPFEYEFVDQEYAQKFEEFKKITQLTNVFTLLAILISCMGLFGLASYMAENRIKEIGVRKVLGSSIRQVTNLLTIDFLKLVLIAVIIAIPISWYIMSNWLEDFEYRISISWWVFALSGTIALLIAFLTVASQAIRAASANPIKSLKTE